MSQYISGTVTVTSGSPIVTGSGTLWLTDPTNGAVADGDLFTIKGSGVFYTIGSVDSDTQITLASNYAGTTASSQLYEAIRDFTPNYGFPYPVDRDVDTASIVKQAIVSIDSAIYGAFTSGGFYKETGSAPAFSKTAAFAISTACALKIDVNGTAQNIPSGTAVTMPGSPVAGTDYVIWAQTDSTLAASSSFTSPPSTNARDVGGFHYAPGGNATGTTGGDTTPAINEYSIWDLNWRPSCPDPRGMTLVGNGLAWVDIYLLNTNPDVNGTSKYNVTICDGGSPCIIPALFGGDGSTAYTSFTWFIANEVAAAYGKRLVRQAEFMAAAYGTTEASSVGTDQVSTILNAAYTSKFGLMQATGVMWTWGAERGGPNTGAVWTDVGRGQEYDAPYAALFGGNWSNAADAGSRASNWSSAASGSASDVGARLACDHLQLD